MWSIVRPASYRSVNGVRPVRPSSVDAPTNRSAPALATVCTAMPRFARRETSSQALKQAIEPVSWNRSRGASLFDIVDEPHWAEADGREPAAVAVGDVIHLESFAREGLGGLGGGLALGQARGQHAMQRGRARALGGRQ